MMTAVSGGLEVALAASIIDMKAEDFDKPIRMSATVLKLKYLAFCVLVLSLGSDDPGRARKLYVSRISSLSRANPSFNAKVVATVSNKRSFTSGVRLLHPFWGLSCHRGALWQCNLFFLAPIPPGRWKKRHTSYPKESISPER